MKVSSGVRSYVINFLMLAAPLVAWAFISNKWPRWVVDVGMVVILAVSMAAISEYKKRRSS